jgi:predicted transcriptional regulator
MYMGTAKYRPAIKIVLKLLECISKNQLKGRALKTHIIQCANLKTTSAEKYINMLKEAGYVEEKRLDWGAREVITYELTPWANQDTTGLGPSMMSSLYQTST